MFQLETSDPLVAEAEAEAEAGVEAAGATSVAELSSRHLSPVMARYFQRTWSHGEGHRLYDADGRAYLDFACGIATTVLGHRHPRVTAAIQQQADQLLHVCSGLGYVEPVARLAALIAERMPAKLDSVFFSNSGTEAIEGALKLARRATGRQGIVAFSGGFHGRTFGSLTVTTSNPNYQAGHGPFLPGVHIVPFPSAYRDFGGDETAATQASLTALERLFAETVAPADVAAVLIEPVLGEGGYVPAPLDFLRRLRALTDEHGILLILDEVQSGYGRTGRMWAFEHAGIVPDVVCLAKAMANGLPLGALVASRGLMERWGLGAHGSTFGGNPVSCAAGVAVLETIEREGLVANAAARGPELRERLERVMAGEQRIGDVRGLGMMIGVEFVKDRASREPDAGLAAAVIARCADEGLLLLTCGTAHNTVRWIPPLDVTTAEIDEGVAIFEGVLREI
ncbi:MAG TPA: aspartate aminotransferase family protein [Candidatus Limnocylindria bacterium]|nr:aspartate aminotransferase family protein [Candidatus Limnocylindria bacterium]